MCSCRLAPHMLTIENAVQLRPRLPRSAVVYALRRVSVLSGNTCHWVTHSWSPRRASSERFAATLAQALSKRIHYGKFVAEAKFLAAEDHYRALIQAQDAEAIMDALTDRAVEQKASRSRCGRDSHCLSRMAFKYAMLNAP